MGRSKAIKILTFPLLLICFSAFAEPGSFGELDSLQKERFIYEVKAALNKAKQEAGSYGEKQSTNIETSSQNVSGIAPASSENLPALMKINGRKAVISLPNGSTRAITVGELLPGGRYQVYSINLNGVSVRRITDGKIIPLS